VRRWSWPAKCRAVSNWWLSGAERSIIDADAEQQAELQQSLGNWLSATLPDYMVPRHRLWLAQLPLTPNGKIDRKRLPALDQRRAAACRTGECH
jgi:acyl-coenzyme A synthetase/AMP-(fatty) acid ligase